jgi:predicted GNAT family acetyltransferase
MTDAPTGPATPPTVHRVEAKNRYEVRVGDEIAGFAAYRDREDQRVLYHTEIKDSFSGRGLSSVLVTQALTDIRESGKQVVPVCPLVAAYLKKHEEFSDIARPVTPETLQWLDRVLNS